MKPVGNLGSVRTLLSTLIRPWATMSWTSRPVKAYFNRFLSTICACRSQSYGARQKTGWTHREGQALAELVRARVGSDRIGPAELVEHP